MWEIKQLFLIVFPDVSFKYFQLSRLNALNQKDMADGSESHQEVQKYQIWLSVVLFWGTKAGQEQIWSQTEMV